MSNVKYGVVFNGLMGARTWASFSGGEIHSPSRSMALRLASERPDYSNARIVKITTRPKGWQAASEAPPVGLQVLALLIDGEKSAIMQASWHGKAWISPWSGGSYIGSVTHWRHLPKPPKGGQ